MLVIHSERKKDFLMELGNMGLNIHAVVNIYQNKYDQPTIPR